jgi:hypothetical protein
MFSKLIPFTRRSNSGCQVERRDVRSSVVAFPDLLRPSKPEALPGSRARDRLVCTVLPRYCLLRLRTSTMRASQLMPLISRICLAWIVSGAQGAAVVSGGSNGPSWTCDFSVG